ncbi:hypothetical protein B296_00057633 [Ensete ventricosum]|uniref:Uncharacterized protein n=1 Tax=Ensete ventricosum TaxID=4639 RepID=A0A426XJN6_ENSVE|nr:hypothetical protein B296_00057633 [Ensete ventricosum]
MYGEVSARMTDLTQIRWPRSTSLSYTRAPRRKDHGRRGKVQQYDTEADRIYWVGTRVFSPIILALEGGPMSQEHPFGNSGAEHRPELNHSQPTKEVTTAAPTPNRFWRMMTNLGFPSPASNPALFIVTTKAFLGLTSQSPVALNWETPLEAELPQRQLAEAHASSLTPAPARSQSRSCDPVQTDPDLDTLSSDTADSLR